jgi:hypothetical protein
MLRNGVRKALFLKFPLKTLLCLWEPVAEGTVTLQTFFAGPLCQGLAGSWLSIQLNAPGGEHPPALNAGSSWPCVCRRWACALGHCFIVPLSTWLLIL